MTPKKRIWFLFAMTLLAGMMAGAALMQVYFQTRLKGLMRGENERYHEYFLRRLNAEVQLTPEQYAQTKALILANQTQLLRIRQRTQPEVEQIAAQANGKIIQSLTPEQAARFKDFIVRFPQPGIRSLNAAPAHPPPKPAGNN
jgi:hypothetical protein